MLSAVVFFLAIPSVQSTTTRVRYSEMAPTPYGEIRVAKPLIEWRVWGDGLGVKGVRATIDDEQVPSEYSHERGAAVAVLERPLKQGTHSVRFEVSLASGMKVEKSWDFRVARGAIATLPSPLQNQTYLLSEINRVRADHGLPGVVPNRSLMAASLAHVEYMTSNGSSGHKEEPGRKGFTGRSPGERAKAFGFFERSSEAVAVSSLGIGQCFDDLFSAPYHRVMFLQPGSPESGAAFKGVSACIKFGGPHENGTVKSPAAGAVGVPIQWDGIETPDPMRAASNAAPYGYPIVLAAFGDDAEGFEYVSARLTGPGGGNVESAVLHRGNDRHVSDSVIIVPHRPFNPNTRYRVEIEYSAGGKKRRADWSFTTSQ